MTIHYILLVALLTSPFVHYGEAVNLRDSRQNLVEEWKEKKILIEMPLKLNVVFLGGGFTVDEALLERTVKKILPWYAPYVVYEKRYLGLNITEIDLSVIKAPSPMVDAFRDFIIRNEGKFFDPDLASTYVSDLEEKLFDYFNQPVEVYWVDAWDTAKWLYENGPRYLRINPDDYVVYFLLSAFEVKAVVEYFVDSISPETGRYRFTGGMSAFGGIDRLYFIDLTSIPLGDDMCEEEYMCKAATPGYYPTLWDLEEMTGEDLYNLLATYIVETVIYIFFRGYLWEPTYEINLYTYLLIIDATRNNVALDKLKDFSHDYFDRAISSLIPYT